METMSTQTHRVSIQLKLKVNSRSTQRVTQFTTRTKTCKWKIALVSFAHGYFIQSNKSAGVFDVVFDPNAYRMHLFNYLILHIYQFM